MYGKLPDNPNDHIDYDEKKLRNIWLAGGCFWGIQAFFDRVYGVAETVVGYANGKTENPAYEDLHHSGHAETVKVSYDPEKVELDTLLTYFFGVIDPLSVNRQGADVGQQYRSGIYYSDENDKAVILSAIEREQAKYDQPLATEIQPLSNFYPAEEYHQRYLDKNPGGYCHVDFSKLQMLSQNKKLYLKPTPPATA